MRTEKKPDSENKPGSDEHADLSTILAQARYTLPIAVMSIPVILGLNWVLAPHNMGYASALLTIVGFGTAIRLYNALTKMTDRCHEATLAQKTAAQAWSETEKTAQQMAQHSKATIEQLKAQLKEAADSGADLAEEIRLEQTSVLHWLIGNGLWGETARDLKDVAGVPTFIPQQPKEPTLGTHYLVITSREFVAVFPLLGGERTLMRLHDDTILEIRRTGNETVLGPCSASTTSATTALARFVKWGTKGSWTERRTIDDTRATNLREPRVYLTPCLPTAALLAYGAMRANRERAVHEQKIADLTASMPRA